MEEDQSEVELQVGIRRNTNESSSLTGWRAPGSHQTHRTWGPTRPQTAAQGRHHLPPPPPGPFPAQTNQPPQNKTKPTGGSPAVPVAPRPPARPLRAPLCHFVPPAGAPKRGRGGGRRRALGNIGMEMSKVSPIPRSSCCARCPPSPTSSAATAKTRDAHD